MVDRTINYSRDMMGASDAALGNVKPENTSAILAVQKASSAPLELQRLAFYQFVEDAFRANFLETLSVGLHPVNIVSGTGITYGILEIKAAPPPTTSVPKTGDGMGIYTLPALMLLSAGTIILLARRRKASQKSD